MKPAISVILCTFNAPEMVKNCLDSILDQSYGNFEVLCIDGGSKIPTIRVIKDYMRRDSRISLIKNRNRIAEGKGNGKWLGFRKAKGNIISIIDQDNVLQDPELFSKVIKIYGKKENLLGILGGLRHDKSDPPVIRYISIIGTDSFFAYRSLDFLRHFHKSNDRVQIREDYTLITGGNCFFYKKKDVESVSGYDQDILVVKRLAKIGKKTVFIVPEATKHFSEKSFFRLIKKFTLSKKAYFEGKNDEAFDYLPINIYSRKKFLKNLFFCMTLIPNFFISVRLMKKTRDPIVLLYPFMAFINLISYGTGFLRNKFRTRFIYYPWKN